MLSASGGFAPRPPPGLCPWTPLRNFRPNPMCLPYLQTLATSLVSSCCFCRCCVDLSGFPVFHVNNLSSFSSALSGYWALLREFSVLLTTKSWTYLHRIEVLYTRANLYTCRKIVEDVFVFSLMWMFSSVFRMSYDRAIVCFQVEASLCRR